MLAVRKCYRRSKDKGGQTLLLFVFFLAVLILFIGLCIDVGFAYITKAQLSKSVDAAALAAMTSISQGTVTAQNLASATFVANYNGNSAKYRDTGAVAPNFLWSNSNLTVDVTAQTTINTYFLRILPNWKTMSVAASGQATRNKLVLALVLDRSGSMNGNGGSGTLAPAVSNFMDFFDDNNDRAAMVSFSYAATTPADVTMRQPFKTDIKNAANALVFDGWTCSDEGLTNALAQDNSVLDSNVVRIIVFFTDGMANTWNYTFACGNRNIAPDDTLYDPDTGALQNNGCSVPSPLTSITGGTVDPNSCTAMHNEAEARAERIAWLARNSGIVVYSIGLGNPGGAGECGFPVLNPDFLKDVANTSDSNTYDPNQPEGAYVIAANSGELDQAFRDIALKILLRLSR